MIEAPARKNLYAIAMTYAGATGMTLAAVSRKFYGNARFFDDFRSGKQSITLSRLQTLIETFGKDWPAQVEWPTPEPILMSRPQPGK